MKSKQPRDTVMFVDDEESNLLLYEMQFKHDFKVITALSGMEALDKLEQHAQELKVVISDMRMPEMDGLEFIKTARQNFNDIHYFILTGCCDCTELELALRERVIEQLFKKPYDYEAIVKAVTS